MLVVQPNKVSNKGFRRRKILIVDILITALK